jgi:hypothetical protein
MAGLHQVLREVHVFIIEYNLVVLPKNNNHKIALLSPIPNKPWLTSIGH